MLPTIVAQEFGCMPQLIRTRRTCIKTREVQCGGVTGKKTLRTKLCSLWKRSKLSAVDIQDISSVSTDASIDPLKSIGAGGTIPSNCSRDFLRMQEKDSTMPDLYQARIPLWCPIKGVKVLALCNFLLVYEMLDWAIGDNPVAEYTSNDDRPNLHRTMEGWKTKVGIDINEPCIGIGVWGDTAVYHTRDSVMLALWSVVTGAHTRSRHWFFACGKRQLCDCGCSGRCTMDAVWDVMRYCLVVMKTQVYPY